MEDCKLAVKLGCKFEKKNLMHNSLNYRCVTLKLYNTLNFSTHNWASFKDVELKFRQILGVVKPFQILNCLTTAVSVKARRVSDCKQFPVYFSTQNHILTLVFDTKHTGTKRSCFSRPNSKITSFGNASFSSITQKSSITSGHVS